jgi:hypothetical protein
MHQAFLSTRFGVKRNSAYSMTGGAIRSGRGYALAPRCSLSLTPPFMEVLTRSERIETLFKGFSPPPTFNPARNGVNPRSCTLFPNLTALEVAARPFFQRLVRLRLGGQQAGGLPESSRGLSAAIPPGPLPQIPRRPRRGRSTLASLQGNHGVRTAYFYRGEPRGQNSLFLPANRCRLHISCSDPVAAATLSQLFGLFASNAHRAIGEQASEEIRKHF